MNSKSPLARHRGEFARAIRNNRFEKSPTGILFPSAGVVVGGVFGVEHRRGGEIIGHQSSEPNVIPTQGLNHTLDVILGRTSAVSPWYIALFTGNVTPGASLTGANFVATCTEWTGYSEPTRVVYDEAAASGGVTDNAANRAIFTSTGSATIYGGALLSASAKSAAGAGDVCLAAARFSSSRAVINGDELAVKYTLTLTSA